MRCDYDCLRYQKQLQCRRLTFIGFLSLTILSLILLTVIQFHSSVSSGSEIKYFNQQKRIPRSLRFNSNSTEIEDDLNKHEQTYNRQIKSKTNFSPTSLSDIYITVKTTGAFHRTRLDLILKTWYQLAKDNVYFFTDSSDDVYQEKLGAHLINTNCSSSHSRKALCCKMSVEFDSFLNSKKRWICHFDDDNYVNIPNLVSLLQKFDFKQDWYLGKPSMRSPLEIIDRANVMKNASFWFATGGAGFCISLSLALKMMPVTSGGKFIGIGEKIRLPDDVTMGYIIENLLQKKLTVIDTFHSHLESMKFLKRDTFRDQITFSYSNYGTEMNTIEIDGFDTKLDPTRFLSLHCYLFPQFTYCPG